MALSDNSPPLNVRRTEHPAHGTAEVTAVNLAVINSTLSRPLGLADLLGLARVRAVVLRTLGCGGASGTGVVVDAGGGGGGLLAGRGPRGGRGVVVTAGWGIGVGHKGGDWGTREGVVAGTEEVAGDAWVAGAVGSGMRDELALGGPASAAAANAQLRTAWVEFSAGIVGGWLRSDMEGDDLVADEVVAGGDVAGKLDPVKSTVHKVLLEPFATVGLAADLIDLEPSSSSGVELTAGLISTASKISDHGTGVVRPVAETITTLPVEAKGVAWVDIHNAGSVLGTNTTVVRWVVDAVDGLKVEHLADGARVAVAVTGTIRGRCLVEGLIAILDRSEITMRRNVGREEDGEKCKSGRAHCSRSVVVD